MLTAIEQGIITESTKENLERLEKQKKELNEKILLEKSKNKLSLTKEMIINNLQKALKANPRIMIELLVKEIRLYNDKVEIILQHNHSKSPDDNQGFSFYLKKVNYEINNHHFNENPKNIEFEIIIYMT